MPVRYQGTLAYDGTAYQGFQRQAAGIPTIQGAVENAFMTVSGQTVTVIGAGRTDTGVHASGQVISFDLVWRHGVEQLLKAVNATLTPDIALLRLEAAPHPAFHARFDATARTYRYQVLNADVRHPLFAHRAWHVWGQFDGVMMAQAAAMLIGTHDFGAFGLPPQGDNTTRTIMRSEWTTQADDAGMLWHYTVEATAFLQHMVRRIVSVLVSLGRGMKSLDFFEAMLHQPLLRAGVTIAPPQGLTLTRVRY